MDKASARPPTRASPTTSGYAGTGDGAGRLGAGQLDQRQAGAPEEAERAEERAAVGDAGAEQVAGRGPDEGGQGGEAEEDRAEQVDGGDRPGHVTAPHAPAPVADLGQRQPAGREEAGRADHVGRPYPEVLLPRGQPHAERVEGVDVEPDGAGELDGAGPPV